LKRKNSPIIKTAPEIIELTIDSLSYSGGRGVGRFEGIVVFVPDVVPRDRVRARITNKKSRLWEAELVEVLDPSPFRRAPPCPVADRCGGCSWQQVSYSQQVEQKEKILRDSLRGLARLGEWEWLPFLPAENEFHYRNRIQLHFRGGVFGFFAKRTRDLITFKECWIADPRLNERMNSLAAADGAKVELALTESGEVRVMAGERDPKAALFAQVNQEQNEVLKTRLKDFVGGRPDWMMDLYAGSGNLTYPLAELFSNTPLTAVELSRIAVERGEAVSCARFPKLRWEAGDVGERLANMMPAPGRGLVVLDPPRTGLSQQVCAGLIRHAPQQIVYVSCNPMTFARDVERLVAGGRFRLEKVQGLDMFPQTEHVELIASLCAAT